MKQILRKIAERRSQIAFRRPAGSGGRERKRATRHLLSLRSANRGRKSLLHAIRCVWSERVCSIAIVAALASASFGSTPTLSSGGAFARRALWPLVCKNAGLRLSHHRQPPTANLSVPRSAIGNPPSALAALQADLTALTNGFPARVGIYVHDGNTVAGVNAKQPFPMQSVMKLPVSVVVLEAVDEGRLKVNETVVIHKNDLSVGAQPLAALVTPAGFRTTLRDLIRRAVSESDNAALDLIFRKCGGGPRVTATLKSRGVTGISVDRDERHLQSEVAGLKWKPAYLDAATFTRAIAAVPKAQRDAAWRRYLADPRDTATPAGMVGLLDALQAGKLLKPDSTSLLLSDLEATVTGPDRLKAGLAPGWKLAHKTGTGSTWGGVNSACNDVGILTAPDGSKVTVAVFVTASKATDAQMAALIASVAKTVIRDHAK